MTLYYMSSVKCINILREKCKQVFVQNLEFILHFKFVALNNFQNYYLFLYRERFDKYNSLTRRERQQLNLIFNASDNRSIINLLIFNVFNL